MYERKKGLISYIHILCQSMLFIVCMEDPYKGLTYHTYIQYMYWLKERGAEAPLIRH